MNRISSVLQWRLRHLNVVVRQSERDLHTPVVDRINQHIGVTAFIGIQRGSPPIA
jgi:hypothetical protein